MKVLKATQTQYEALNGYTIKASQLLFIKDKFNNWIVGKEVLNDPNFEEIQNELSQLKEINYEPTPEPIK
jgi:hypothetical protein